MIANIGALLGRSTDSIDVEFAIDARHGTEITGAAEFAILSFPTWSGIGAKRITHLCL
jgi:hypothetical protein